MRKKLKILLLNCALLGFLALSPNLGFSQAIASPSAGLGPVATSPSLGMMRMNLIVPEPEKSQVSLFFELMPPFMNAYAQDALKLEYIPGIGGSKAWQSLQGRSGDGSQMAGLIFPNFFLKPLLNERRFTPEKISPVAFLAEIPLGLWVSTDSPFNNLHELVVYLKNEEEVFYFAGVGSYSSHHMATQFFNRSAGVFVGYLPYLGSEQTSEACKKDSIASWGAATPLATMPGMRLLAIASVERSPIHSGVPTFNEANIEMQISEEYGLALPADSPEETKIAASALMLNMVESKEFSEKAEKLGFTIKTVPYDMIEGVMQEQEKALKNFLDFYIMN